ncbi:unnamed protein product [Prorocentrum cordatum]|uniref:Uncharacterized protein n=1 Tax=Prorocentrum cordatum TaxID=2364126 RepID=A0ABN9PWP7_9DINO|nr:unnamed protein product [Polarella glacialis]
MSQWSCDLGGRKVAGRPAMHGRTVLIFNLADWCTDLGHSAPSSLSDSVSKPMEWASRLPREFSCSFPFPSSSARCVDAECAQSGGTVQDRSRNRRPLQLWALAGGPSGAARHGIAEGRGPQDSRSAAP